LNVNKILMLYRPRLLSLITTKYEMLSSYFIDFIEIFSFLTLVFVLYFLCKQQKRKFV
jgi:hypothetical protein